MSFRIRREAFEEGIKAIRIIPYYGYGICIRIHDSKKYELWNYNTIPLSTVSKAVEYFLTEERSDIKEIYVDDKIFNVPEENIREHLLDFLTEIEKSKLDNEEDS